MTEKVIVTQEYIDETWRYVGHLETKIMEIDEVLKKIKRSKKITEWALEECDDDEVQNIIWIDCRLGFWIEEMERILNG